MHGLNAMLPALGVMFQILMIDLLLAGDNAVVVGMAVVGLPADKRRTAIWAGIGGATVIRIGLTFVAVKLLAIVGLMLAGGVLLLWVCWKMYRELRRTPEAVAEDGPPKSFRAALLQIMLADISMSLDNVLAVAGAAHNHPRLLVAGLLLSVVLMAVAANLVARLLERYRWLAWIGLLIVLYVALELMWQGYGDVARAMGW